MNGVLSHLPLSIPQCGELTTIQKNYSSLLFARLFLSWCMCMYMCCVVAGQRSWGSVVI